jgi:glutamate N-acetyltransferase/amino-acid N-acetyltransferase
VVGARSYDDADRAARYVAEDQLVRCALYGADPNWGRIVAALGVCGVDLDTDRVAIDLGGVALVRDGIAVPGAAEAAGEAARARQVDVRIDLAAGPASAVIYGSDLSTEYVLNNSEYTT